MRIKRSALLLLFIVGSCSISFSQIQSTLGWFEVNYQQGCTPLSVSVKTTIPESDVPIFQFNGRDDTNQVPWLDSYDSLTHPYNSPGTFMIYLTVQNASPVRSDSIQITVIDSVTPAFELRHCSGSGVLVDISDTFYDAYQIDYGDGTIENVSSPQPPPFHFYSNSGNYLVTLVGKLINAPNNCGSATQPFTATNNLIPPIIRLIDVDSASQINLHFNLPQNSIYQMEVSVADDQSFQFFTDLSSSDTLLVIANFSPEQNEFCFRIAALNPCGGNRVNSNVVCNIISSLMLTNNTNSLGWSHIETGQEFEYRISRNTIPDFITIPSGTNSFDDTQILCETNYCYSVTTVYADGSESLSPNVCGIAFSTDTPPIISNLGVDVVSDGVRLDWELDTQMDTVYLAQYSSTNNLLKKDTSVVNARFFETDLSAYPQTCYTHSYIDVCTNTSKETPRICSIYLTTISNADGSVTLSWSEFTGFTDSISNYFVQKFDHTGASLETIDVGTALTYNDIITGQNDQIVRYVIEGIPSNSLFTQIHSNAVLAARQVQLHFPTAFTPDGDGLNDEFKPEYMFIKFYDLKIYSRWGQLIFSSEDVEVGWDGLLNGKKVAVGNYTFLANAEDFQGLKIARSGIVTILKN